MSGVEKVDFNSTLLPNIGDARQSRRLFISRVISSAFLYAAPVWASALDSYSNVPNWKKIVRPYQLSALRAPCAYSTTSVLHVTRHGPRRHFGKRGSTALLPNIRQSEPTVGVEHFHLPTQKKNRQ